MFVLRFDKVVQAIAHLLRRESSHDMNFMRLLKILYIADRESIRRTGTPITGDRVVAMPRGPVLSGVYDLIKGQHVQAPEFQRFFSKEEFKIRLIGEPGVGKLSRFDIEVLDGVAEKHRAHDEWEMVDVTHEFPEWKKNSRGTSSHPIPFEEIVEAVGWEGDTSGILEDAKANHALERLFGS